MIYLNKKQSNNKNAAPIKKPGISIPKKLEILEYLLLPEDISIQPSTNNNDSLVNNKETLINNHSPDLNLSSKLVNELSGKHGKYMIIMRIYVSQRSLQMKKCLVIKKGRK